MTLSFNHSGVLPPFLGDSAVNPAQCSPYEIPLLDFVKFFSTTPKRKLLLISWLKYRLALKKIGVVEGFQWIDGSFVEDVENNLGRPPDDIDLVTFGKRPSGINNANEFFVLSANNSDLFVSGLAKQTYNCDAYFVDLGLPQEAIVKYTTYWFGLFSHQRATSLWKGIIEIDLSEDEGYALKLLEDGGTDVTS